MDEEKQIEKQKKDRFLPVSILLAAVLIAGAMIYKIGAEDRSDLTSGIIGSDFTASALTTILDSKEGVTLPAKWGDLGKKIVESGVIDAQKFEDLYASDGGLSDEEKNLLYGSNNGNLRIDARNSGVILNLLWAFGLANKNDILEKGPMTDLRYGGAAPPAGGFASTGGWTISKTTAMDYYSRFPWVVLGPEEQALVERVAKSIYRPCCNNSAYFPDCNHGMAMLGFLEIMASQGVSEEDMYKAALAVNSFWFPDTYLTIEKYLKTKSIDWAKADPKGVLGENFSSYSGFSEVLKKVTPVQNSTGAGCGV